MNLQAIKEKVEGLKEDKARAEERLKSFNEKKEEILEELKEYGVKSIKGIDGKVNELKKELNIALKDFDEIETEEEVEEDLKRIDEKEDARGWEKGENYIIEGETKKKKGNDFLEDLDL